jgi:hypothetical protein
MWEKFRFTVLLLGHVTPRRWGTAAASTRLFTPSLRRMFETWTLAVFSETNKVSRRVRIRTGFRRRVRHVGDRQDLVLAVMGWWGAW